MMDKKYINLPYTYAIIDENNRCMACRTYSYEIPLDNYIPVPVLTDEYTGKYYNPADGLFYYEPEYITVFDPEV